MTSDYIYEPLKSPGDLRLLEIRRGSGNDALKCCFLYDNIQNLEVGCYSFTAISYTWGDPSPTHRMLVEECSFWTTKNAYEIVHKMRQPDKAVRIWIDAICINQTDNTEKNVQVQTMGEIYSRADMTIVYLGEQTHNSNLAFDFLGVLRSRDTLPTVAEWEALHDLFTRPWFWRVWAVQEVVLSRAATFLCGERMVTWEAVCQPMQLLRQSDLARLAQLPAAVAVRLASGVSQLGAMLDIKSNNDLETTHIKRRLSFIFYETMSFLASNPRDKVYGILGLSPTSLEGSVDVDYSKSVQDVYLEATAGCLAVDHVPDILYLAGLNRKDRMLGLPSWVPDFSHDIDFNPYGFTYGKSGYRAGIAHGTRMKTFVQNEKLIISGYVFDKVLSLGSVRVRNLQSHDGRSSKGWYDWMAEALNLAKSSSRVGDSSQNNGMLWRTFVANQPYQTNYVPPEYGSYFEHFMSIYMTNTNNRDLSWQEAILDAIRTLVSPRSRRDKHMTILWHTSLLALAGGLQSLTQETWASFQRTLK